MAPGRRRVRLLGLAVYLLYALRTPPEQAESAKHRAGVTPFMLVMAVLAILCYAVFGFLLFTGRGPDTTNFSVMNVPTRTRSSSTPRRSSPPNRSRWP